MRALLGVYDKTGIEEFARGLVDLGWEIVSTGGTFATIEKAGIPVRKVEEITGFPEMLDGRVKTLHPVVHGGILARRDLPTHMAALAEHGIGGIDLVCCNLYPFVATVTKPGVTFEEGIENIDIGGPTMLRAAAKNHKDVIVVVNPGDYAPVLEHLRANDLTAEGRLHLAYSAFAHVAQYDSAVSEWLYSQFSEEARAQRRGQVTLPMELVETLRYGENPHQKAVLIKNNFDEIYEVLHGKELSYNNLLDMDAAYNLIAEFKDETAACAIIKHGNPSGVAVAGDLQEAYARAFATDTLSPFGGIIVINKKLDFKTSLDIDKLFSEIIMAPDFENEALELLMKKKNRRLVKFNFIDESKEFRKISGGVLYQDKDNYTVSESDLKFVTDRKASSEEIEDMLFAFKVVKHTKSNAVIFVKDKRTLAIGGGQPSRIDSTKIAVSKAKEFGQDLKDSIAASDAFFPFPDGLIEIAKAGAAAIIQPGGSVKDEDVVKAADEYKIAMAFTGIRHFKH